MACGAVPLVEAGTQEVPMLFQADRHYFSYEPDRWKRDWNPCSRIPPAIEAVSLEARLAVGAHAKAKQIRSLLEFTGAERRGECAPQCLHPRPHQRLRQRPHP